MKIYLCQLSLLSKHLTLYHLYCYQMRRYCLIALCLFKNSSEYHLSLELSCHHDLRPSILLGVGAYLDHYRNYKDLFHLLNYSKHFLIRSLLKNISFLNLGKLLPHRSYLLPHQFPNFSIRFNHKWPSKQSNIDVEMFKRQKRAFLLLKYQDYRYLYEQISLYLCNKEYQLRSFFSANCFLYVLSQFIMLG